MSVGSNQGIDSGPQWQAGQGGSIELNLPGTNKISLKVTDVESKTKALLKNREIIDRLCVGCNANTELYGKLKNGETVVVQLNYGGNSHTLHISQKVSDTAAPISRHAELDFSITLASSKRGEKNVQVINQKATKVLTQSSTTVKPLLSAHRKIAEQRKLAKTPEDEDFPSGKLYDESSSEADDVLQSISFITESQFGKGNRFSAKLEDELSSGPKEFVIENKSSEEVYFSVRAPSGEAPKPVTTPRENRFTVAPPSYVAPSAPMHIWKVEGNKVRIDDVSYVVISKKSKKEVDASKLDYLLDVAKVEIDDKRNIHLGNQFILVPTLDSEALSWERTGKTGKNEIKVDNKSYALFQTDGTKFQENEIDAVIKDIITNKQAIQDEDGKWIGDNYILVPIKERPAAPKTPVQEAPVAKQESTVEQERPRQPVKKVSNEIQKKFGPVVEELRKQQASQTARQDLPPGRPAPPSFKPSELPSAAVLSPRSGPKPGGPRVGLPPTKSEAKPITSPRPPPRPTKAGDRASPKGSPTGKEQKND